MIRRRWNLAKIVIFKTSPRRFYWALYAGNGTRMATCDRSFSEYRGARRSAQAVRQFFRRRLVYIADKVELRG
jgi:hypothetical protein